MTLLLPKGYSHPFQNTDKSKPNDSASQPHRKWFNGFNPWHSNQDLTMTKCMSLDRGLEKSGKPKGWWKGLKSVHRSKDRKVNKNGSPNMPTCHNEQLDYAMTMTLGNRGKKMTESAVIKYESDPEYLNRSGPENLDDNALNTLVPVQRKQTEADRKRVWKRTVRVGDFSAEQLSVKVENRKILIEGSRQVPVDGEDGVYECDQLRKEIVPGKDVDLNTLNIVLPENDNGTLTLEASLSPADFSVVGDSKLSKSVCDLDIIGKTVEATPVKGCDLKLSKSTCDLDLVGKTVEATTEEGTDLKVSKSLCELDHVGKSCEVTRLEGNPEQVTKSKTGADNLNEQAQRSDSETHKKQCVVSKTQKHTFHNGQKLAEKDATLGRTRENAKQSEPVDSYKLKLDLKLYKPSWMQS